MEAADMLDVIHVLFEEDITPSWEHSAKVKSELRRTIYESMYKSRYNYGVEDDTPTFGGSSYDDAPIPETSKPYIPPTVPDELEDILGPPMGES